MKASLFPAVFICSFFTVCDGRSYGRFELNYNVTSVDGLGPVIYTSCTFIPSPGVQFLYFTWHSGSTSTSDKKLAERGVLVDEAPTRYTLHIADNMTEVLSIHNALKEDSEDRPDRYLYYKCTVGFSREPSTVFTSHRIRIPINEYLPALNHPVCNVNSLQVLSGSEIEFTCSRGDSNPEVNLQLSLLRPGGSVRPLGINNVTTSVFLEDNNANFTCEMTSDAFPTAYRSCSAGPLTVLSTATAQYATLKTVSRSTTTEITTPTLVTARPRSTTGELKISNVQEIIKTFLNSATSEYRPSAMTTESLPEAAQGTCITISAVVPLAIGAFVAILTNIYLLMTNYKLKKKLLVAQNKKSITDLVGVDEPYMELQKTQVPSGSQDYMALQQIHEEKPGSEISGYENVKKGKGHPLAYDSPYESVE